MANGYQVIARVWEIDQCLLDIISEIGVARDDAVYLGDSLFKDVAMAQSAGVDDVLAKYGESHTRSEYDLLRAVTHWTSEQVQTVKVAVSSDVAFQILNNKRAIITEIEEQTGKQIIIRGEAGFTSDQIEYLCEDGRGQPVGPGRASTSETQ